MNNQNDKDDTHNKNINENQNEPNYKDNIGDDIDSNNDKFVIPICFNEKVQKLNDSVVNDLELHNSIDTDEQPIYDVIFAPSNNPAKNIVKQISKYYTTDTEYLKQSQQLTKSINSDYINTIYNKNSINNSDINEIADLWNEIKTDTGFCEKYLYVEWSFAKELNNNRNFLHLMSLYNISSPIISLCLPIIVLIIPFFIIKLKGAKIGIQEYCDILKSLISNHAIFKVFTQFHEVDNTQKIYLLLSAVFYLFSLYQNILSCIKFYSNMQKIHNYLLKFKKYLQFTIDAITYHNQLSTNLTKYSKFNYNLNENTSVLVELYNKLKNLSPFTFSFSKVSEIGDVLCIFYQLHDNSLYNKAMLYSFGFNGYFNIMSHLSSNITQKRLKQTTFVNKGKPIFKKMYYPKFIHNKQSSIIKNNCNINKNMIITGPNASGKTTTLKTVLINIILSQQFGFGCFDSLKLKPYDTIHCYLNIPDTSGRDSLFQAEARRCKEIIDCIDQQTNKSHFCIFDELYSGTNPEEAVDSANAFMDYIVKNNNVTCMLTTHYIKLCKKLSKNDYIKNYNMKTIVTNNNLEYTYIIQKGISKIKGGIKVLLDMKYPKEILNLAQQINNLTN